MKIYVDSQLCKSCKICMHVCPANVYALSEQSNKKGYNYVTAVHPEACTGCKLCEISCPDMALYVDKNA